MRGDKFYRVLEIEKVPPNGDAKQEALFLAHLRIANAAARQTLARYRWLINGMTRADDSEGCWWYIRFPAKPGYSIEEALDQIIAGEELEKANETLKLEVGET